MIHESRLFRTTVVAAGVAVAVAAFVHGAGARSFTIDPAQSTATIAVGKAGVFSFAAGHSHEVEARTVGGRVTVDVDDPARSTVHIVIEAAGLQVTGRGESADDVPKVQATMTGAQVLDVRRYPTITFTSTNIAVKTQTGPAIDAVVTGDLAIRGTTRSISVPITARIEGQTLSATGRFPVRQTEFGIKPVSVGGVVSVKDVLEITFRIVGH
jgi:polyisoprenoid-binding protein YceI